MTGLSRYASTDAPVTAKGRSGSSAIAGALGRVVRVVGFVGLASLASTEARAAMSVGTGNLFEEMVDYAPEGPDRLAFVQYYNSLGVLSYGPTAPLGMLWRSIYNRCLVSLPNAPFVIAERADGQVLRYKIDNGVGAPDSDIDVTLVRSGDGWILTDRDGTVEAYGPPDRGGRACARTIKAPDGYAQTLDYNDAGQVVGVTDSRERTLNFAYEGGTLHTVATPDGLTLTYGYDSTMPGMHNDRLVSVTYSTGPDKDRTYLYAQAPFDHSLTGVVDAKGNRLATWTYDNYGRATSSQLAGGANLTTISYDKDTHGNPINTVTNARGERTVYKFTRLQRVAKVTEIDWPATPTRAARTELYVYDERGYLIKTTDSNGNETDYRPKTQSVALTPAAAIDPATEGSRRSDPVDPVAR